MQAPRIGWLEQAAVACALALLLALALHHDAMQAAARARSQAQALAEAVAALPLEAMAGPKGVLPPLQHLLALARQPAMAYAVLVAADGRLLAGAPGLPVVAPAADLPATADAWNGERDLTAADGQTRVHEFHAAVLSHGELAGFVRVAFLSPAPWAVATDLPWLGTIVTLMAVLAVILQVLRRKSWQAVTAVAGRLQGLAFPGRVPAILPAAPSAALAALHAATEAVARQLHGGEGARLGADTSGRILGWQKARSEAVLNALPDAVVLLDAEGKVSFASGKLRPLLGVAPEDTVGRPVREWCPVESLATFLAPYQLAGERAQRPATREYQAPGQAERHVTATAVPLASAAGAEFTGTVVNFRDTTQERLASRARDEFVSHVAHELKSPLQVLAMYSEMLQDNPDCERSLRLEAANAIHSETLGMAELIGNLLSIGRIESGSISLDRTRVRLPELLREVFRSATASATGLACHIAVPEEMTQLSLDKGLLAIALKNLVTNAVKYNRPDGSVTLLAEEHPDRCVIRVRDSGIGVGAADRERIFDKFYRSAEPEAAGRGGHGLGLYLTRQIVELHGGELSFDSTPGEGSEFRVVIRKTPQALAEHV